MSTYEKLGTITIGKDKHDLHKRVHCDGSYSWNELEDKPFYKHVTKVKILPETTFENADSNNKLSCKFIEGNTYIVTYNGTQYECIAKKMGGFPYIGNYEGWALDDWSAGSGEPFRLREDDVDSAHYPCTISIESVVTTLKTLDEEFLPNYLVFKQVGFDDFIGGIATAGAMPSAELICDNMTYEQAVQHLMIGNPLQGVVLRYEDDGYIHSDTVSYFTLQISTNCITIYAGPMNYYWTAYRISTEVPE